MSYDNSIAIVIPFYKTELNKYESLSIKQALDVFSTRQIKLIIPRKLTGFDFSTLPYQWTEQTSFVYIDDIHLSSIRTYNAFLLSSDFYKLFSQHRYILIYQFDSYVFGDELDHWIRKDYDYVGAPIYPHNTPYGKEYVQCMGVGGFSLRKVESFIRVIGENKRIFYFSDLQQSLRSFNLKGKIPRYAKYLLNWYRNKLRVSYLDNALEQLGLSINEDVVFGKYVPQYYPSFRVADYEDSIAFSIDRYVEEELQLLRGKLPFGIHAWWTNSHNLKIWSQFINL